MPLYVWLGGLLFKLTGPGYGPLRGLSLLSTVTSAGLIFWIARRESGQSWLGLACAGLFLGGYRINGFWYELVRVDSLFVALSLAGLMLGVYGYHTKLGLGGAAVFIAESAEAGRRAGEAGGRNGQGAGGRAGAV